MLELPRNQTPLEPRRLRDISPRFRILRSSGVPIAGRAARQIPPVRLRASEFEFGCSPIAYSHRCHRGLIVGIWTQVSRFLTSSGTKVELDVSIDGSVEPERQVFLSLAQHPSNRLVKGTVSGTRVHENPHAVQRLRCRVRVSTSAFHRTRRPPLHLAPTTPDHFNSLIPRAATNKMGGEMRWPESFVHYQKRLPACCGKVRHMSGSLEIDPR